MRSASATTSRTSEIKLEAILSELIEESPFKSNRKPIWNSLNITSAALSQYLSGRSRPRLETLVALADFFGVSLDYLVLGRQQAGATVDDAIRARARYVDWAIGGVQARVAAQTWLVGRIAQVLATRMETVAADFVDRTQPGGALSFEEMYVIERYSLETSVATNTLEYDVVETAHGDSAAGQFAEVVATNLRADPPHGYLFLVAPLISGGSLDHLVHSYRSILTQDFGVPVGRLRHCRFRRSDQKIANGTTFYRLDVERLLLDEPVLYELLRPYISRDGRLGYTLPPNNEMRSFPLIELNRLDMSIEAFNEMWKHGTEKL